MRVMIQTSLRIREVWSELSNIGNLWTDRVGPDETARMRRLS